MNKLKLTKEEKKQLKTIHKYTYNNSMRENRIRTVLLYDKEMSKEEIKEILLLDLQTIRRYINNFQLHRMDSIDFVVTIPQKANTTESTQKQYKYQKLKKELKEEENILFFVQP